MKKYKLKFSSLLYDAKSTSNINYEDSKYVCNICLNSRELDLSNKISFLTLITYFSIEREKNAYPILSINTKLSKYISSENNIDTAIFIRSLYRTARILKENYNNFYRSHFYLSKINKTLYKANKFSSDNRKILNEEIIDLNKKFNECIIVSKKKFNEIYLNDTSESQAHIDKLFEIQNVINALKNGDDQCKEGYIISVKWLLQMELFIDEYLKFFEIRNDHNSDKSFGKYKRTKTDRVFDEFMSKMFDISKIKESIVNEGDNFNIPNTELTTTEIYYPGQIDNFPLVKWKDLFPYKSELSEYTENVILRKDITLNKHYYIISKDNWDFISSLFDANIIIKRSIDELSLVCYKIFFLFPELKLNNNYKVWSKLFYLQMSTKSNITNLKTKLEKWKSEIITTSSTSDCITTTTPANTDVKYNFYSISKEHKEILNDFICIYRNTNFNEFICSNKAYLTQIDTNDDTMMLNKLQFNPEKEILIIEQYTNTSPPFIVFPSSINKCIQCNKDIKTTITKCNVCSYGQFCSVKCLEKNTMESTAHNILHEELFKYKAETLTCNELFAKTLDGVLTKNDNKGLCGLCNLGNTCYMNSALQCLSHTEDLTKFLLLNIHEQEMNISTRLGSQGNLSKAFHSLIFNLWKGQTNKFSPDYFKSQLGLIIPRFNSFNQQDSQEFLSLFLDHLHEDLNRISNKPYVDLEEQQPDETDEIASQRWWDSHKKREDSIISDLFHGQFKSFIQCPDCKRISITYDPFMFLALTLNEDEPVRELNYHFKYFYFDSTYDLLKCVCLTITLTQQTTVLQMIDEVKLKLMITSPNGYEAIIFDKEKMITGIVPEHHFVFPYVNQGFEICIYNKEQKEYNNIYVYPSLITKKWLLGFKSQTVFLSYPLAIAFGNNKSIADLQEECYIRLKRVLKKNSNNESSLSSRNAITLQVRHTKLHYVNDHNVLSSESVYACPCCQELFNFKNVFDEKKRYCPLNININNDKEKQILTALHETLLLNRTIVLCACSPSYKDTVNIYDTLKLKFKDYIKESLTSYSTVTSDKDKITISNIYDAIKLFSQTETLRKGNEWYCNKCKEHKEANKKLDIYRTPNYLIIQFKRFKTQGTNQHKKIDMFIDFPINNLDLSKYVIGPYKDDSLYDLYGIVNHYGTMNGGHYIAICKNDNKWYEFNDSSVSSKSPKSIISNNAYLLFYKKRFLPKTNN